MTPMAMLSIISSPAMRRHPAPSAERIASSCSRPWTRTSIRLATLAQAINSTIPTVPISTQSTFPISPEQALLQREKRRSEAGGFKHVQAVAGSGREAMKRNGNHSRGIGLRLRDGDAGFQAGDGLVAEITEEYFGAIELQRNQYRGFEIQKTKLFREDADHFAGFSVQKDAAANHGGIAAEFRAPQTIGENDCFWIAGLVVLRRKQPAKRGLNAEDGQDAIGDIEGDKFFGLRAAGKSHRIALPQADVLKGVGFFAVGEIEKGSGSRMGEIHARGGVVDVDQFFRTGERQWIEQNPFNHRENRAVRANADGQSQDGDRGKQGSLEKPPENVFELHVKNYEGRAAEVPLVGPIF